MRLALFLLALLAMPAARAQTVWYVDADATGSASGTSWADAFPDLQLALAAAASGDEVWVAEGLYRPTSGSDRAVSFVLPSGVALYGGFDGTETSRDERDWTVHETILSGDLGDPENMDDNSFHVVVANDATSSTVIDGITVQDGSGAGVAYPDDRGAGILAIDGYLTIRNTRFFRNAIGRPAGQGDKYGAGMYSENGSPLIEDSIFEENTANAGGGVYFEGSDPILRRVVFRENAASQLYFAGGSTGLIEDVLIEDGERVGLIIAESSPHFIRVTVRGNLLNSGDGGGAIISFEGSAPIFEDCLFEGNRAARGAGVNLEGKATALFLRTTFRGNIGVSTGAAVNAVNSTPVFLGCRFERNRGSGTGGLSAVDSGVTIIGSTFVGNTSTNGTSVGGGLFVTGNTWDGTPSLVANSLFAGNYEGEGAGIAAFNVNVGQVLVVNTTFAHNEAEEAGGAIYASNASGLQIQNSILWGNTAPDGPEIFTASGAPPMITQSLVAGGYPSGTMILDEDPQFVRAPDPGPDSQWGTPDDDYGDLRLSKGSPAVDYGLVQYLPPDTWDLDGDGDTAEPLPVDLQGGPRQLGASPDLGAYEGAVRVANEPGIADPTGKLALWPNPASDAFRIRFEPHAEAVIVDVLGREVRRVVLGADGVVEVATAGLAAGVYVVRVGRQSGVVTVRR